MALDSDRGAAAMQTVTRAMTADEIQRLSGYGDFGPAPSMFAPMLRKWLFMSLTRGLLVLPLVVLVMWMSNRLVGGFAFPADAMVAALASSVAFVVLGCAWYVFGYARDVARHWPERGRVYREDVEHGQVIQRHCRFSECRTFSLDSKVVDLMHVMKIDDLHSLVVYECERDASDPNDSGPNDRAREPIRPSECLTLLHAPVSGLLLQCTFSGRAFDVSVRAVWNADWPLPDPHRVLALPWSEVEQRFDASRAA